MSLNNKFSYIVFDFETGSRNPDKTQLTQIAAIALHSKKLTLQPGGIFNIEVKPEFDDEKAVKAGFEPVEQGALDVTRKTREQLEKATDPKIAWQQFTNFVNKFNPKGSPFFAPIPIGYNINNFDMKIVQRYCEMYGPTDNKNKQKLFHQIYKIDLMDNLFAWFENNDGVEKLNMDYLRGYFGFGEDSKKNAHDALQDVLDTGEIAVRFLKFHRAKSEGVKFEKSFANSERMLKI